MSFDGPRFLLICCFGLLGLRWNHINELAQRQFIHSLCKLAQSEYELVHHSCALIDGAFAWLELRLLDHLEDFVQYSVLFLCFGVLLFGLDTCLSRQLLSLRLLQSHSFCLLDLEFLREKAHITNKIKHLLVDFIVRNRSQAGSQLDLILISFKLFQNNCILFLFVNLRFLFHLMIPFFLQLLLAHCRFGFFYWLIFRSCGLLWFIPVLLWAMRWITAIHMLMLLWIFLGTMAMALLFLIFFLMNAPISV